MDGYLCSTDEMSCTCCYSGLQWWNQFVVVCRHGCLSKMSIKCLCVLTNKNILKRKFLLKIFVGEKREWLRGGGVMRGKACLFACDLVRVWIEFWKLKHEAGSDMPRAWRCLCRPGGRNRLHCTGSPVAILGMPLTCPFRVVQPFATSPCPAFYQPSPRVVHLVPRRISVGVQLGFVKGKKINGSAFHADSARLALLGWKRAWIPPGDSKCYLIRNCLPFHMLFTQTLRHRLPQLIWNGLCPYSSFHNI